MPYKVHIGGLFRCCIQTVIELPETEKVTEGYRLHCKYCSDGVMEFRDGAFHVVFEDPAELNNAQNNP